MENTLFLSQLLGIVMIISGIAVMLRRRSFIPIIGEFAEERLTRLIVSILELVGGLAIVLSHNVWSTPPEVIISLFGWILTLEGTFYLLAPNEVVEPLVRKFNVGSWYVFGGLFSIVLGAYMVGTGFGLI